MSLLYLAPWEGRAYTSYMLLMPTCDRKALRLGCASTSFWGTDIITYTTPHASGHPSSLRQVFSMQNFTG